MEVKKIKKLNNGKYKIEFENNEKLITFDEVILKNNVLFNKEIDEERFNQINIDNSYYNVYSKVLNYISKRIRSEKEIKSYISKFELDSKDEQEIVQRLKDNNFINDINFMKAYINDRIYLSNTGPYKIKNELLSHNIDETLIEEELSKISENHLEDKIRKIISKKIKANKKHSAFLLKQKIINELINAGYDKNMINNIYDNFNNSNDLSVLKKEYDAAYKKLSKKYSQKELDFKIKGKLLQKGYSLEEINKIINE